MPSLRAKLDNNQADRFILFFTQGCIMTFIERLERKIKRNFPEISEQELKERLAVAKHLIAFAHEKNRTSCPKNNLTIT